MTKMLIQSEKIGQSIKILRTKNEMTQEELADRIGYSVRSIRRIENNGTNNIETVNEFAAIFNVSALDILSGCFLFHDFLTKEIQNYVFAA